jgi:hypothetical protein
MGLRLVTHSASRQAAPRPRSKPPGITITGVDLKLGAARLCVAYGNRSWYCEHAQRASAKMAVACRHGRGLAGRPCGCRAKLSPLSATYCRVIAPKVQQFSHTTRQDCFCDHGCHSGAGARVLGSGG